MKKNPSRLSNTLKDTLGIIRAVTYRTFIERNWSKPQPMFNILQIKKEDEKMFEEFLRRALVISLKSDTPLSLGPYRTTAEGYKTYIYITHYASTRAYIKVMNGLLFGGVSKLRDKAIRQTSWTYCSPTSTSDLTTARNIIMVGIQGNPNDFLGKINHRGITPLATVKKIKDVRGNSLGNYILFEDSSKTTELLHEFREEGGSFLSYKAARYN